MKQCQVNNNPEGVVILVSFASFQYIAINDLEDEGDAFDEVLHIFNGLLCDLVAVLLFFLRKCDKLEGVLALFVLHEFKECFIVFCEFSNVALVFHIE